jgi:hypothetical protein
MSRRKDSLGKALILKIVGVVILLSGLFFYMRPVPNGVVSPINGKVLNSPGDEYEFLLIGHAYGSQNRSVYPSASLLANMDIFNAEKIAFVMLLGDIIQYVKRENIEAFYHSFAKKLSKPIFNAIGNHDNGGREAYKRFFGQDTFYSFRHGSELFVVLDGERDNGRIVEDQLEFLRRELGAASASADVKNIFLFSHRLLWAVGNPAVSGIIPMVNGPDMHHAEMADFYKTIRPVLLEMKGKKIYLIAGDVGMSWSFPLFYHSEKNSPITYVATGIGDNLRDHAVVVRVRKGAVSFEAKSLTGLSMNDRSGAAPLPLEHFGVSFWTEMHKKREAARKRAKVKR